MITKEVNIVVKESGMDKVNQSITQLENAVHDTEQATKSFKSQMREANQELLKMSQKFGETSQEAVTAAKKVADLKDQMGLANDLVNSFNPDQKFKALGAATQVAGTGLQGVTSGMALFGDQSESTQKTLLQVQAAMSFSDAISNLSNLGDQWVILKTAINNSNVAQKVYTAATGAAAMIQKAFTGSVATTTTGFKLLRGAIIATGIGALVVGVGLLIANFDKVKKVVLNFIPGLAKVGDMVMNIVNSVTDFIGVTSEAGRLVDKQKEVAEKALKQNETYLKKNEHKLSEARKREIELSQEHYQRVVDGEMSKEESLKVLREKGQIDRQKAQEEANKIQAEKAKEANEKAKEAEQKRIDDEKERVEKILEARKDELQKFNDVEKEFEEQRENDRIKKLQDEEDAKNKTLNDIEATLQARQNGLNAEKQANEERIRDEELVRDAKFQIANSVFDLVNMFAKKGSKLAKGVAVAQATMNTYQGVTAALAAPSTVPEPFGTALKIANSVAIGATGFLNVKKILSTNEQGGGSAGGGGGGASAPQAPSFNLVQGTGRNQLAESIGKQAPVKAFVVSRDMTTAQETDRNIIKSASL